MRPIMLVAVFYFALLAYTEGDVPRSLALAGLVVSHPAARGDVVHELGRAQARWGLDEATAAAGLARGAALDLDAVVQELLYGRG